MRRQALCILIVLLAGCVGGLPVIGSNNAPAYPDRPAPLTRDSVLTYATQYERAAEYRATKEFGNRVELSCNSTIIDEAAAGFYVAAGCATTVRENGGVGSGGPGQGQLYFINDTTTIRMTPPDAPNRPLEMPEAGGATAETTIYYSNFDSSDHTLTTTLSSLDSTSPERVRRSTDSIDAQQGVVQRNVPLRTDVYRITVRLDDGSTATRRWTVTERSSRQTNAISVYVTPGGDLRIVDRPWIRV